MTYRKLFNYVCVARPAVSVLKWKDNVFLSVPLVLGVRNVFTNSSDGNAGFKPAKVAVVTKTTRCEFEQQRYRYSGLSEQDLKQLLAMKGSSYSGLLERHSIHTKNVEHIVDSLRKEGIEVRLVKRGEYNEEIVHWADAIVSAGGSSYSGLLERHSIHTKNVEHIVDSLRKEGIEVRLVKRGEYNEEIVQWADAIVSAGGDGTMLLVASKVMDRFKPVVGVNTDPERWQWRHRSRIYLEGTGINLTPVDLHEQQMSLEQHSKAHRISMNSSHKSGETSGPHLLPVRALNEVFIGESLSSRASYYEISVDDGPWEKQKSSGVNVCTGTGSKAWSCNINKLAFQAVEDVLKIGNKLAGLNLTLDKKQIEKVTEEYNESLVFNPEEPKMFFSVREPIVNRVFSSSRQRGFTTKVCVRSRCWDACMVVDGGTSFEFNDGALATIQMNEDDALLTVVLE
ncbi:UNVERIFIED_CONTAM: hypothetical protein FKN15_076444 [Acipenser sinensis]